ncbi:MAG: sugar phosphate isomerase/epimerase [Verrucomicrobiota bacterium]|nr:sugar phosphate isomerase/epimerase [Verrucomicrobiota bacterium]
MNPNRRSFLQFTLTAAAAAGATWFDFPQILAKSVKLSQARAASLKKYGGFPMGIQSYSLRAFGIDGKEGALQKIDDLGLHWVEFFGRHYPISPDKAKIAAMNAKLAKHDLSASAHGVNGFSKNHEANEKIFQFAKLAGIPNISANPSPDSFDSLDKLVAKYNVRIAIHNHGPGALYDKIEDGLKAVKGHDKRIGFCADLGHYIRSAEDPVEVIHKLGDRLYGIHLKDFAEQKKKTHGVILGKGHLDVKGVFKALKKIRFPADGALSLEYEENAAKPIPDIQECLAVAAEGAQKALEN